MSWFDEKKWCLYQIYCAAHGNVPEGTARSSLDFWIQTFSRISQNVFNFLSEMREVDTAGFLRYDKFDYHSWTSQDDV